MKTLPQDSSSGQWESQLVQDLSFIRKHRRYPFRRMTLMPLAASTLIIGLFIRFVAGAMVVGHMKSVNWTLVFALFLMAVPTAVAFRRYIDLIRFYTVPTSFFLAENMSLLQQFLEEQRLVVFRHPEAPEVFQIISRNISAIGDEREVLIFIADDKRILVNSHFTSSRKRFRLFSAPTHHLQMVRELKNWLASRDHNTNGITKVGP
jgi:hypothetical protein